jgi:hypothetical protein
VDGLDPEVTAAHREVAHQRGRRAAPSPRPAPERAAVLAAAVDARLARTGVVLAFGTPTVDQLASARLGCRRPLPLTFGDDLAALCPR